MRTKTIRRRELLKAGLGSLSLVVLPIHSVRAADQVAVLTHTAFLKGLGGEAGPDSMWANFSRQQDVNLQFKTQGQHSDLRAGFFRGNEAETGTSFLGHGALRWTSKNDHIEESDAGHTLARSGVSWLRLHTDQPFLPPLRHFLANRAAVGGGRT